MLEYNYNNDVAKYGTWINKKLRVKKAKLRLISYDDICDNLWGFIWIQEFEKVFYEQRIGKNFILNMIN